MGGDFGGHFDIITSSKISHKEFYCLLRLRGRRSPNSLICNFPGSIFSFAEQEHRSVVEIGGVGFE